MIRRLLEKDRDSVFRFLSKEPSINLFLIGDIEAFGFKQEFQDVWGQFTVGGELEGVLLRYNQSFIPYFIEPNFDVSEFKNVILNNTGKTRISGKESILKRFEGILPNATSRITHFCELTDGKKIKVFESDGEIKIAKECDAERVYNIMGNIEEFSVTGNYIDMIKHKIKTETGRIYYIENDDGIIVSVAQTTAENSKSAMVMDVATLKEYRNKGLMKKCLSKLCMDVILEGKTLCLFYDNPSAGNVYHNLGFDTIDNWMMITEG